ncbi:hypothetical protein HYPSUDRAFT_43489 [Hypholoma sublateritium FD-334 SS-4]|uniref:Uncharacterized protein n=1 Tax=Hypholoma sublateritium (strain FD-334 SS-4) TaxID=945553 RepID=A0A0D2NMW4_HYPSF|nr:hypothetical protein HYPSUDRAFT_43489 [Hypholoma sublateritium FD-334 SS-4]
MAMPLAQKTPVSMLPDSDDLFIRVVPFAASMYDPTPLPTHLLGQRLTPRPAVYLLITRPSAYLIPLYVPSV